MKYTESLIEYLKSATMAFTAVTKSIEVLEDNGFEELRFGDNWMFNPNGRYYVRPFFGSLVAWTVGENPFIDKGFRIITSHTDSPAFRIKGKPEVKTMSYLKLNVDVYGGPLLHTWLDRPLSMAGNVILRSEDVMKPKVVEIDFKKAILTIPSVAIHFERKANDGVAFDRQKNLPLMAMVQENLEKDGYLNQLVADEIGCKKEDILDVDLFVYCYEEGMILGADNEFFSAPRLDNLAMVYGSVEALVHSKHENGINMIACLDNEEIGSTTKQGADSMFLKQVVDRIGIVLNKTQEQIYRLYSDSFMISADGAHASHPNAQDKNDITNMVYPNGGLVIKYSMNQKYATDGYSAGVMQQICEKAGVPYQKMFNRSGIPGGSTLGPIANKYLPIDGVDVGLPMLAMHSARELVGVRDMEDCIRVFQTFFHS